MWANINSPKQIFNEIRHHWMHIPIWGYKQSGGKSECYQRLTSPGKDHQAWEVPQSFHPPNSRSIKSAVCLQMSWNCSTKQWQVIDRNSVKHDQQSIKPGSPSIKFKLNAISGLYAEERKFLDELEARKFQKSSMVWPKVKHTCRVP